MPEVVIVFAQVVGATSFSYKRNRTDTHALRKAITRCMLQMLDELPETEEGRDGYLCRCQEADLKYMVGVTDCWELCAGFGRQHAKQSSAYVQSNMCKPCHIWLLRADASGAVSYHDA